MNKLACAIAALSLAVTAASAAAAGYRILDRIKGPDGGWDFVRVDPSTNLLWMTRGTSLMTVDLTSRKVTSGIVTGQRLHDVLLLPGGTEILVTQGGTDTALFADAKTGQVMATIPTGKNPDAAAYDPSTGLVLVMEHNGGDVVLIDPKRHKAVGSIAVGGDLEMAATDGQGGAYLTVEDKNDIAVLDLKARKVVRRIALPGCDGPTGVAYIKSRGWLIASCDGGTTVVEARSGALVKTLKTGKAADGVAVDDRRHMAFVPGRDGSLSVISLKGAMPAVIQVLKTEPNNRTLALDPRDGRIYLPVARLAPGAEGKMVPVSGSFQVVVVGP